MQSCFLVRTPPSRRATLLHATQNTGRFATRWAPDNSAMRLTFSEYLGGPCRRSSAGRPRRGRRRRSRRTPASSTEPRGPRAPRSSPTPSVPIETRRPPGWRTSSVTHPGGRKRPLYCIKITITKACQPNTIATPIMAVAASQRRGLRLVPGATLRNRRSARRARGRAPLPPFAISSTR